MMRLCPICGRKAMHPAGNPAKAGVCDACGANLGGVNAELIRAARRRVEGELVWENESQLVIRESAADNGCYKVGETGVCDPRNLSEVQISISSYDRSAQHEVFSKLEGVPVRITIVRVPGGNV